MERRRRNRKTSEKKNALKRFTPKMQASLLLVFCLVILIFFGLLGRIIFLEDKDGEKYEKRVLSQQTYVSNAIPCKRGEILDRNMTAMAVSVKVYNLILDPALILEKKAYKKPTADALNKILGIEPETVNDILKEKPKSHYYQMKDYKGLDYETVQAFEELKKKDKKKTDKENEDAANIKGIWFEEEYVRTYPLNTVGSSVIGFTQKGDSNVGNWGVEENYNEELSGTNGREYGYFNSELELERTVKPAVNGHNIIMTIDANVQSLVEKRVKKYLDNPGAENVGVVLMNPQNGEIYAMVSNEAFDLNNPRDLSAFYTEKQIDKMSNEEMSAALSAIWRNFCISDAYEPGSTFKPFTVAAALDEHIVTDNSSFECAGSLKIKGYEKPIKCNKRLGHGHINLRQSLMFSCNVAMMKIGAKMGRDIFADYLTLYGFGKRTGIDLPGEALGTVYDAQGLNGTELATSSFGQSNAVTMIQMCAGFSSLINGGNYYVPHIVKEIQNENGATVEKISGTLLKKTTSQNTSTMIKDYLFDTVEEGTAEPAKVKGFEIGGKTGTAEKKGRDKTNYIVSFLGFTPVEDPQVVIYVVIDQPNEEEQDHSSYATEFAHSIMKEVLPFLGVYPNTTNNKKTAGKKPAASEKETDSTDKESDNSRDEEGGQGDENQNEEGREGGSGQTSPDGGGSDSGSQGNQGQEE